MQSQNWSESFKTGANRLGEQIQHLVHEGNIRHVVITQDDRKVAQFSVTVGVIGAIIAPYLAAIGLIVLLVTGCSIKIEHDAPVV